MSPVRGFISEGDAWGYYLAHRKDCERPKEFVTGEWEVPNGFTKVTMVNPIKGVQRYQVPPSAKNPHPWIKSVQDGKEDAS